VTRFRIIAVAVFLGVVGAALPMAGVLYVSWMLAHQAEQNRLSSFATRTIVRANKSLSQISEALHAISKSGAEPCSAAHIAEMRRVAFDTPSVDEIGYFEGDLLACTSWGKTERRIEYVPGDYKTAEGLDVTIRMQPFVTGGKPKMALRYEKYNALVDPLRFVDVIVDPGIQLAIATDNGALIGDLNAPDQNLLKSIISQPRSGMTKRDLFAVAEGNGWLAIAIEPRDGIFLTLRREQILLLPVGLFIALFIVALVVWFSRRRLSPLGELAIAVQRREFIVHYQPIIRLKDAECIGCEALVRWRRPDGSLVRPDHFIPLAEESGLILPITDQVIERVVPISGST
jgi:sensor c-di-GMP phosphodiesterase-like protein